MTDIYTCSVCSATMEARGRVVASHCKMHKCKECAGAMGRHMETCSKRA